MFYGGKELKWIWLNMWPNADPLGRTRERKRYTIYMRQNDAYKSF